MKILILTTIRAPYRVQLFNLLGQRCDLTVCFEKEFEHGREKQWFDKDVSNFVDIQLRRSFGNIKWDIHKIIKTTRPDLAIAYEYSTVTSLCFMMLCRNNHIPYLINCDGGFIKNDLLKSAVKKYFMKKASGFLAGGIYAKKYMEYYDADSSKVLIHNFSSLHRNDILNEIISLDDKREYRRDLGIDEKYEHVVVAVGQFIYRKGFDILINACKGISRNTGIFIIGGVVTEEYLLLCKKLSLNNIHFIEFQDEFRLKKYYQASDLVVLPTREDIWGLVINEAMACGAPVITTNKCIAGLELIVNGENGFIVDAEAPDQLAKYINVILNDSHLREKMAKNNLVKIMDYTIESMADKQWEYFQRLKISTF